MSSIALGWAGRIFGSERGRKVLLWLAVVLGVLWFYNWAENNGESSVRTEVAATSTDELQRQISVLEDALRDASARAQQSAALNRELERQVDAIRQAAQSDPNADHVCVPADISERLRGLE